MNSFQISESLSYVKPPKEYKGLKLPVGRLVSKKIAFSNSSSRTKHIFVDSDTPQIVIKTPHLEIPPHNSEYIQLRMYFPTASPSTVTSRIRIYSDDVLSEQLLFRIQLIR